MSISQPYSTQAWTDAGRARIRGVNPCPRIRTSEGSAVVSVMGPAGRAPGIPIMGAPGPGLYVMGGPDARRQINLMGAGDRGAPLRLFGAGEPPFVGSLFAAPANAAE